jgi:hypothetical protein
VPRILLVKTVANIARALRSQVRRFPEPGRSAARAVVTENVADYSAERDVVVSC